MRSSSALGSRCAISTSYPAGLDNFVNPSPGTVPLATPFGGRTHSQEHGDLNDAVEAIQTKVGVTGSTVAGTVDKRLQILEGAVPAALPSPLDAGLTAWNFDPAPIGMSTSTGILLTGQPNAYAIRLPAGAVTNLLTASGGSGTATNFFMALYTAAGVLVAQSTNQVAAFNAGGLVTCPIAGAPVVVAGKYYAAMWFSGGASAAMFRITNSAPLLNFALAAANLRYAQTGQTGVTTTAPANISGLTQQAQCIWVGAS